MEVGQPKRREVDGAVPHPYTCDADVAAAAVAVVDDLAVLHLDPSAEFVGEAEPVGEPQLLEVLDHVGWGVVVVGHARLERHLRQAGDRLRRDP
jgi:hypothetical protein